MMKKQAKGTGKGAARVRKLGVKLAMGRNDDFADHGKYFSC